MDMEQHLNKKDVFAYGLQDGKTKKLSIIQAKDMTVTDMGIVIEDIKGKKKHWKNKEKASFGVLFLMD